MRAGVGSPVSGTLPDDSAASFEKRTFLFRKEGAAHEILMPARSVFIPLTAPEYQLLALGVRQRAQSLHPATFRLD